MAPRRGLLVDYGGVLTGSLGRAFGRIESAAGLPDGELLESVQAAYRDDGGVVGGVERGEVHPHRIGDVLAEELRARGVDVAPDRLLRGLGEALAPSGPFWDVVSQAHDAGVRTALVSNSWGVGAYPRERLGRIFDALVISGEVGLRKPDPEIFRLAARRLGLEVGRCAFVDDLDRNVEAAERLGMRGVLYRHRDLERVVGELRAALGVDLEVPDAGAGDALSGRAAG